MHRDILIVLGLIIGLFGYEVPEALGDLAIVFTGILLGAAIKYFNK